MDPALFLPLEWSLQVCSLAWAIGPKRPDLLLRDS